MTENKRIFMNITATYCRSLYSLLVGIFCGRWTLLALGEIDYGLNGLVGGLSVFVAFFNNVLASANARFYAISIGAAKISKNPIEALENSRRWFNTALFAHSIMAVVLIAIGYPAGVFAIENWLTIPKESIRDCVSVFRFVSISCFVGMLNVPFMAMYHAKQYIAELTVYGFVTTTLNAVVLWYMVSHPQLWLVKFAAWSCALSLVPQIVIIVRALIIFDECKIRRSYLFDFRRLMALGGFCGWQMIGMACGMLRINGLPIVINKVFGVAMNAAYAIGNSVQGQCNMLSGSMQGAFTPAIVQACGARQYTKMNTLALMTSRLSILLYAIFAVPVALEINYLMKIWLVHPPEFAGGLCIFAMILYVVDNSTIGHMIVVNASGRIACYQTVLSCVNIFTIPLAFFVGFCFRRVYFVMISVVCMQVINSLGRVVFARILLGTSVTKWLRELVLPLAIIIVITLIVGASGVYVLEESFFRLIVVTILCELTFIPLAWLFVIRAEEKEYLISRFFDKIPVAKLFLRKVGVN